jgi:hypothetical protein
MTTPAQPDLEAGARFLEKLLAGSPARLDVATDEQVVAMMDAAGIEDVTPESVEQALARGERRARERATRARGTPIAKAKAPPPKRGTSRTAWVAGALVAAAAAAVVATELAGGSRQGPEAIGPDHPGPGPTPQQQAKRLRNEALAACDTQDLLTCGKKLDEAEALDPAGESEPRVVGARKLLALPPVLPPMPDVPLKPDLPPKPPTGGR